MFLRREAVEGDNMQLKHQQHQHNNEKYTLED